MVSSVKSKNATHTFMYLLKIRTINNERRNQVINNLTSTHNMLTLFVDDANTEVKKNKTQRSA